MEQNKFVRSTRHKLLSPDEQCFFLMTNLLHLSVPYSPIYVFSVQFDDLFIDNFFYYNTSSKDLIIISVF